MKKDGFLNIDWQFDVAINPDLENAFRDLVTQNGGTIIHTAEIIMHKWINYIIQIEPKKRELIVEFGFYTFIKNPKFQKYYLSDKNYVEIAKKYIEQHGS